jgi:hypothetical protein
MADELFLFAPNPPTEFIQNSRDFIFNKSSIKFQNPSIPPLQKGAN